MIHPRPVFPDAPLSDAELEKAALEAELPRLQSRARAERAMLRAGRDAKMWVGAGDVFAKALARVHELDREIIESAEDAQFISALDQYTQALVPLPALERTLWATHAALYEGSFGYERSLGYRKMLEYVEGFRSRGAMNDCYRLSRGAWRPHIDAFLEAEARYREATIAFSDVETYARGLVEKFIALADIAKGK